MQNKDQASFCVKLTEENLSSRAERGYINGTGSIIDDVAYALNLWTWGEVEENNLDYFISETRRILNAYDWETYTRDRMNADSEANADPTIAQSEYLAGDWYEINDPRAFREKVRAWKNKISESILEVCPFNRDAEAPQNLLDTLESEIDRSYDYLRDEWLRGDRSNDGVLNKMSKHFTGTTGAIGTRQRDNELVDTLFLEFTEEQARNFMGYEIAEDAPVTEEVLTAYVISHLLSKVAKRRAEANARAQSNKQRAEERQRIEAEKLEAKKTAARARKQGI